MTLRLKNVKFGQALDSVLTSAGGNTKLRYFLDGNVIRVTAADEGAGGGRGAAPAAAGAKGSVEAVYNVQKVIGRLIPEGADEAGAGAAAKSVAARRNALVKIITGSIAPATWKANGGTGEITQVGNELVINTAPENQKAIANLLEQLETLVTAPATAH